MRRVLGRLRRAISAPESVSSSGLDANPSGLQRAAELFSVTGKRSHLLPRCHSVFLTTVFLHRWAKENKTLICPPVLKFFLFLFFFFFLFKQVMFLAVFQAAVCSLKTSLLLQDVPPEDLPLTRLPRSREALTDPSILTCVSRTRDSPFAKTSLT